MNYVSSNFTDGGSQFEKLIPLVVAALGIAASLVNGNNLHSTIQLNFGDELINLADSSLDKLRNSLEEVVFLIIDEMSLIRSDLFYQLQERWQQIKQNDNLFGGVAVLLFGDLLQLKPVRGRFIFQDPRCRKYADYYDFCNLWTHFQSVVLVDNHRLLQSFGMCIVCFAWISYNSEYFRQQRDVKWIQTLQRVRNASLTERLTSMFYHLCQFPRLMLI